MDALPPDMEKNSISRTRKKKSKPKKTNRIEIYAQTMQINDTREKIESEDSSESEDAYETSELREMKAVLRKKDEELKQQRKVNNRLQQQLDHARIYRPQSWNDRLNKFFYRIQDNWGSS